MLVLRWGPWSGAAVVLAAGVIAGLLIPGAGGGSAPGGMALLLSAGALPAAAYLASSLRSAATGGDGSRRTGRPRAGGRRELPPALALLGIAWTGLALGGSARERALAHCAASIRTGQAVHATGRVVSWSTVEGRWGPGARIRLEGSRVRTARGECPAGPLLVLADGSGGGRSAGSGPPPAVGFPARVTVTGTWWRYPGVAGRPRPEGRHGLLRAEALPGPGESGASRGAPGAGGARGIFRRLRRAAGGRLSVRLGPNVAPLGTALLLADRDGLPSDLRERFADAGLAHLLAVSGLHVGIVGGLILGLAGLISRDRRRYPASAALTLAYVAWIGAPPSAVRAGLLYAGWALCRLRGAPTSVLEILAAAAVAAILADPLALLDVGFQLSFAGFFGLLVGIRISAVLRPGGVARAAPAGGAGAAVGAAAGAFLATAPLVAAHFQRLTPVAVASGLAAAPLVGGAVPALAATVALPEPAGSWAADAATGMLRALVWLANRFAGMPGAGRPVPPPGPAGWSAVALGAVAVLRLAATGRPIRAAVPAAAALCVLLAWPAVADRALGEEARICVLDVGQGDAVAVRTADGGWMLVDGGPGPPARDAGLESVVPHLRRWGVRRIDVLVITHPHLDHVGGALSVLEAFPVRQVWDAATVTPSAAYRDLLEGIAARKIRWRPVVAGDRFRLDGVAGMVLAPPSGAPWGDPNESSVVLRLSFPSGGTALLAGDAGPREEDWMLRRWPAEVLRAGILKVAHHGSRSSTRGRWLAAVRPRLALISAGEGNRYGHPHPRVLGRLEAARSVEIRRTDREGTVCVSPDRGPSG